MQSTKTKPKRNAIECETKVGEGSRLSLIKRQVYYATYLGSDMVNMYIDRLVWSCSQGNCIKQVKHTQHTHTLRDTHTLSERDTHTRCQRQRRRDSPCGQDERIEFRVQMPPYYVLRRRNAQCGGHGIARKGWLQHHQTPMHAAVCKARRDREGEREMFNWLCLETQ